MKQIVIMAVLALLLTMNIGHAQLLHGVTDALSGGGSITPPSCNGTIDLSKGCTLPMFGGL